MEDICQTEQDEMRVIPFRVFHKHSCFPTNTHITLYGTLSECGRLPVVSRTPRRHVAPHRVPDKRSHVRARWPPELQPSGGPSQSGAALAHGAHPTALPPRVLHHGTLQRREGQRRRGVSVQRREGRHARGLRRDGLPGERGRSHFLAGLEEDARRLEALEGELAVYASL